MKIIVDTNIVFSAVLNTNSKIADILFNSDGKLLFYSPTFLRVEIEEHKEKLQQLSGYSDVVLAETIFQIFETIQFISDEQIPFEIWKRSIPIVREVDMDDLVFIALADYMNAFLWTGDKILYKGAKAKGFENILTTNELIEFRK